MNLAPAGLNPIPTKLLTHAADLKSFSVELSCLEAQGYILDPHRPKRLVNDVGTVVDFIFVEAIKDLDGDVNGWSYMPTMESRKAHPRLAGYTFTIFND